MLTPSKKVNPPSESFTQKVDRLFNQFVEDGFEVTRNQIELALISQQIQEFKRLNPSFQKGKGGSQVK